MKEPISISFCISDNYAQHLAVVLTSILVNNPDEQFVFHVVHHSVTPETEAKVRELETMYPHHRILFHKIDESIFQKFPTPPTLEHVTRETYYRYILPDILPPEEKRTIYSDIDVLCVKGGIRDLFETDLKGRPIAAILDGDAKDKRSNIGLADGAYFCAGLLVIDISALRASSSSQLLFETTTKYAERLAFADQDTINIAFDGRILELSSIWNCADRFSFRRTDVIQWHFQGFTQKPWCNLWKNVTWIPYLKYLLKSPYKENAWGFVWGHIKGFFFFSYTKNRVTRYLICGIRIWKRSVKD